MSVWQRVVKWARAPEKAIIGDSKAWLEGERSTRPEENPYAPGTSEYAEWVEGFRYDQASRDAW